MALELRPSARLGLRGAAWLFALSLLAASADAQAQAKVTASTVRAPTWTLENGDVHVTVTASGGLAHVVMKNPRYQHEGKQIDVVSTDKPAFLPFAFRLSGIDLPAAARFEGERLSSREVRLHYRDANVEVTRKIELGAAAYQLWSTLRVRNLTSAARKVGVTVQTHAYVKRALESSSMGAQSPHKTNGICVVDGSIEHFDREDIVEDQPRFGISSLGAVGSLYFTQALSTEGKGFVECKLTGSDRGGSVSEPDGALLSLEVTHAPANIAPGASAVFRTVGYFGPKVPRHLQAAGHGMRAASDVGGIAGINAIARTLESLLEWIHAFVGNWGVAIILLTVLVKSLLYPLTARSMASMAAMRNLKPQIDVINERFGSDREKKGAAMMALYKEHKINPLGGCLPQLLQLPIWWSLYMSLSSNVELLNQPFFWFWRDLTAPDPYYVLPLALGAVMFIQQKITPTTLNPAQAKMMLYMMPTMLMAFMLFLPAGLCLYTFTNTLLGISQQRFIEYRLARTTRASAAKDAAQQPVSDGDSISGGTRRGRA